MGKRSVYFFVLVGTFVGVSLTQCATEEQVRADILQKTPIGIDMNQVMAFCASQKLVCKSSNTAGYLNQHTSKIVGVKSVWTVISEQRLTPLTITTKSCFWGFDKDGRLIDVWVWKTTDAP